MISKDERQKQAAERWRYSKNYGSKQHGSGAIVAVTGFGKTRLSLDQIVNRMLQRKPDAQIVILVHRIALKQQWIKRVADRVKNLSSNVYVTTVQYLIEHGYELDVDLLIVDELHKFYGDEYVNYINGNKIKFKYNLGLTATYQDPAGLYKRIVDIYPIVDTITKEEALENSWISKYIEYNLGVELTNNEVVAYNKAIADYNRFLEKFSGKINRATYCLQGGKDANGKFLEGIRWATLIATEKGWHKECDAQTNTIWNPNKIIGYAANLFESIRTRDKILNNAENKYAAAVELFRKFNIKTMIFSQNVDFANRVGKRLNDCFGEDTAIVYHSQLASQYLKDDKGCFIKYKTGQRKGKPKLFGLTTLKKVYLEMFTTNKVKVLCTAKTLDEGFDCEDIRLGIIASRSSNYNQQIQRGGRIIRVIPESPDETMLIVNLYCLNTTDERRLDRAQKQNVFDAINATSIDDVTIDFDDDQILN
jgi:superfamily II DNA or RNA helicase